MGERRISTERGIEYGTGKLLDVYVPRTAQGPVAVLLWHGSGARERDVLEPLARRIATAGIGVIVPDWSVEDGSDGRHDLSASLSFARNEVQKFMVVDRMVLAGWSLGASAGLDVILHPEVVDGWRPVAFIGISGGYRRSPFHQEDQTESTSDPSVPLLLLHGSEDEVVPIERSRITLDRLREGGWPVTLHELPTDHAGAIGTVYDPMQHRCVPAVDSLRLEVLTTTATKIAELASSL